MRNLTFCQHLTAIVSLLAVTLAIIETMLAFQLGGMSWTAPVITVILISFIYGRVSLDDDEDRAYIAMAWLCVVVGVVLMAGEHLAPKEIISEDILLGLGAMWALAEEVRLYKRKT